MQQKFSFFSNQSVSQKNQLLNQLLNYVLDADYNKVASIIIKEPALILQREFAQTLIYPCEYCPSIGYKSDFENKSDYHKSLWEISMALADTRMCKLMLNSIRQLPDQDSKQMLGSQLIQQTTKLLSSYSDSFDPLWRAYRSTHEAYEDYQKQPNKYSARSSVDRWGDMEYDPTKIFNESLKELKRKQAILPKHFLREFFRKDTAWDTQSFDINLLDNHDDFQQMPESISLSGDEPLLSVNANSNINYDYERFVRLSKIRKKECEQLLELAKNHPDELLNSVSNLENLDDQEIRATLKH